MGQNVAFEPLAISWFRIIRIERRVHMNRKSAAVIANREDRQQSRTGSAGQSRGAAGNVDFAMKETDRLTFLFGSTDTNRDHLVGLKPGVQ